MRGVGGKRVWGPTQTSGEEHIRSSAASVLRKDGSLHLRVFAKRCKPVRYLCFPRAYVLDFGSTL